jgi:hypothetical protein
MSGVGLSRFAKHSKAAVADNSSNGPPAQTPGREMTTAPAASFDGYEMMNTGQEFGGDFGGAADFGYGGGMEDYNMPYAPMDYTVRTERCRMGGRGKRQLRMVPTSLILPR